MYCYWTAMQHPMANNASDWHWRPSDSHIMRLSSTFKYCFTCSCIKLQIAKKEFLEQAVVLDR